MLPGECSFFQHLTVVAFLKSRPIFNLRLNCMPKRTVSPVLVTRRALDYVRHRSTLALISWQLCDPHMNAAKEIEMRNAKGTPTPMPISVGSSGRGVTVGLGTLLDSKVANVLEFVLEFALAVKYAEGVGVRDDEGSDDPVNGCPSCPTHAGTPTSSTNSEITYACKSELEMVAGLVTVKASVSMIGNPDVVIQTTSGE